MARSKRGKPGVARWCQTRARKAWQTKAMMAPLSQCSTDGQTGIAEVMVMYLIQTLSRREAERTRQREPGRGGATRWEQRERAAETDDDVMTPPQEGAGRGEGADGAAASGIGEAAAIGQARRVSRAGPYSTGN